MKKKELSFGLAVTTIAVLAAVYVCGFAIFHIDTRAVFVLSVVAMSIMALIAGHSGKDIETYFVDGARSAVMIVLILMTVGVTIGAWVVSGTIPTIIVYGLQLLTPKTFLVVGFLITCVVSFFTGSSYTALATIGVAFMGIGAGLGVSAGLTAGMVVSGAIFGDKMSPFSDTTNLAPAVAGTDIFKHINSMMYTTVPALIVSAILYAILGASLSNDTMDAAIVDGIISTLKDNFNITPILFLLPVLTIVLAVLKLPALTALLISGLTGVVFAFVFQNDFYSYTKIFSAIGNGFTIDSGNALVDRLLNRGGIMGMMSPVALALMCLGVGEMLQRMGVLDTILKRIEGLIKSPRSLVLTTLVSCLVTAAVTAAQLIAIVLPGQLLKNAYTEHKIDKRVLSRTLEDGGTIFAFLIPWAAPAIYASTTLGVSVMEYVPYAFLAILCPIFSAIYAITGIAIFKDETAE